MRWSSAVVGLSSLFFSGPVLAAETAPDAEAAPEAAASAATEQEDDRFGHFGQAGLRLGLVGGYRMVFRYEDSPLCREDDVGKATDDQRKFCGHGSPLALDLGLSFGMLDILEPFLWGRFGLTGESATGTAPIVVLGGGARFYATADSRFKVFIEPAVGFELEGGGDQRGYEDFDYKTDLLFHIAAGPQLDITKNVGVYADAGLTVGIFRSIHSTLELQGGVQARFP